MNKQIKWGIILQYTQMILSILISLVYTPFMLRILGQSQYGLYNIATSVLTYLPLITLGLGSGYIRYYFVKRKQGIDSLNNFNGLYLFIFSILGLLVLMCGLILSFNSGMFLNSTYSPADFKNLKIMMILLSINTSLALPSSIFVSYIQCREKFVFEKCINIFKTVLSPSLTLVLLFMGFRVVGLVITVFIVNVLVDIFNVVFCIKKLKMKFSFKKMEFPLLKEILVFSIFISINQFVDMINWQTDKIIIGKILTSSAVSLYAIGSTLNTHFIQFSTAIFNVFVPKVNKIVQDNGADKDKRLIQLMTRVGRLQFSILYLILTGFIFFGKFFILKWAGENYESSYYVALLLMTPSLIPGIQNIGLEILRAEFKHKFRSIVNFIIAFVNLGLSIFLCAKFGIVGAAFGTTFSLLLGNCLILNLYYKFKLKLDMGFFWLEILKLFLVLIVPTAIGLLLSINGIADWISFVRGIVCYVFVYFIFLFTVGLKKEEKIKIKESFFKHAKDQ